MRNLGDRFEIRNIVPRVPDGLDVNRLGATINGRTDVLRLITLDEFGVDPQAREEDLELVVGTTVKVAGGDNVVPSVGQGGDGHELRGLAGRGGNSSHAAFEGRNALFKDIDRRLEKISAPIPGIRLIGGTYIHDATVDVSEFLEAKQPRAVGGVIEGVGLTLMSNSNLLHRLSGMSYGGGIDGHCASVGCGVRFLTGRVVSQR